MLRPDSGRCACYELAGSAVTIFTNGILPSIIDSSSTLNAPEGRVSQSGSTIPLGLTDVYNQTLFFSQLLIKHPHFAFFLRNE